MPDESRNQLPKAGDWMAVRKAVNLGMKKLRWTQAQLSRESGVSERTISGIWKPQIRQRTTLVALSAALGYEYGYLEDVLRGQADPDNPPMSVAERAFNDHVRGYFHVLDRKLDQILDCPREDQER